MTKRRPDYQEMARIEDEKVEQGREAEGIVRVQGEAGQADHIMMLRFSPEEIALVRKAAAATDTDVYQFVRDAVFGAAAESSANRPSIVREVQAKARDLANTVEKL